MKKTINLKPVVADEFQDNMKRPKNKSNIDYAAYFKPIIEMASKFSIGSFCWFIPDQSDLSVHAVSENIHAFTPYTKHEWEQQDGKFWIRNFHPNDQGFVAAASVMTARLHESFSPKRSEQIKTNLYARMQNAKKEYSWVLIQFPGRYYNDDGTLMSVLILATDLSHLKNISFTCSMTLVDHYLDEVQFFIAEPFENKYLPMDMPSITKRELEIMQHMIRGLNTPQIAKELFISYSTVENHKKNLRVKTKTKTSVELINFVLKNNLI